NGIVAQGDNPEQSMSKLQEAIESFLLVSETEEKVDQSPISISELHEFLTIDEDNKSNSYELRKVYA
ncbi:MAG: type II toxin-antitoxin system HicB family antitoxin, partial [Planktothrix agardhii KL2]